VKVSGLRAAERLDLTLDVGSLRARAQGSVNLIQSSADLSYTLEAPEMTLRPGLAWQRVSLQGHWHGTVTTPTADGRLQVEQFATPRWHAAGGSQREPHGHCRHARVHAVLDGLAIPGPQPKVLQDAPLTIDASTRLNEATRPLELVATHRLFALRAHAITAGQQSVRLDLHLPDLAAVAALGGQDLRGDATVKGNSRVARRKRALVSTPTLALPAARQSGPEHWVTGRACSYRRH